MNSKTYCDFILERIHFPGSIILNIPGKTYTCGRGKENQILCLSLTVSRQHCSFFRSNNEIYVIDLGSSNGVFVNDIKQQPRHMVKLNDNDIIGIGCPNSNDNNSDMFIYKLRYLTDNEVVDQKLFRSPKKSSCKDIVIETIDDEIHCSSSEYNVNKTNNLVSSNNISEPPKVINKPSKIEEKSDNELKKIINKINSNPDIILLNTTAENNTIKQNTTSLYDNYNSKCQRNDVTNRYKTLFANSENVLTNTCTESNTMKQSTTSLDVSYNNKDQKNNGTSKHKNAFTNPPSVLLNTSAESNTMKQSIKSLDTSYNSKCQRNNGTNKHQNVFTNPTGVLLNTSAESNTMKQSIKSLDTSYNSKCQRNNGTSKHKNAFTNPPSVLLNTSAESNTMKQSIKSLDTSYNSKCQRNNGTNKHKNVFTNPPGVLLNTSAESNTMKQSIKSLDTSYNSKCQRNNGTNKHQNVFTNPTGVLLNTSAESNTMKQSTTSLDTSYNSKCQRNNGTNKHQNVFTNPTGVLLNTSAESNTMKQSTTSLDVSYNNKDQKNNGTNKHKNVFTNPTDVLTNTSVENNTVKQSATNVNINYKNKCRKEKKNTSKCKNLSETKSVKDTTKQKDPLKKKPNDLKSLEENDVILIDLCTNVDTKIVQPNKISPCKNKLVNANDNDDVNIPINDTKNVKISQQQHNYSNNENKDEKAVHDKVIHDNLKTYNEKLMTENRLNELTDKPVNIMYNGDYYIKMEDEIIISDDEQIQNNITNSNSYTESTIKLKQVKQEPKLRFSEIDIVNLSDNEEDVFPCSQLFDSNIDSSFGIKKEVKKENNDNRDEDVNRVDDTEIIISLSDSEDEDNKWLDRLSRSQLLNDTISSNDRSRTTIKDEPLNINQDIDIDEDIKNINKISDMCSLYKLNDKTKEKNKTRKDKKNTNKNIKNKDKNIEQHNNKTKLHTVQNNAPDISSDVRRFEVDHEIDGMSNKEKENNNNKHSLLSKEKITATRKRPLIIDAPHMPVKRKRNTIDNIVMKSPEEKQPENTNVKKKKRIRKTSSPKLDKLLKTSLSKEEKKKIVENRKNKLKKIATDDKKESNIKPLKHLVSKPIAKVSLKTRSDFLIDDIQSKTRNIISKPTIQKNPENKELTNNVNNNLGKSNNTLPPISSFKIKKKTTTNKETLCNVTKHLQQSSNVNDVNNPQLNKINNANTSLNKAENLDNVVTSKKDKNVESTAANNLKDETNKNVIRIQKENRSPNRQTTTQLKKKSKSVSFKAIPEIHEYEIEPQSVLRKLVGKDAPIPVDKLYQKKLCDTNSPKLEEFFLRIFHWNPVWLEEQKHFNRIPPILKENELHPMITLYKSYNNYYKIAEPLLLLEIWSGITKEFEGIEGNSKRPTMMCSIIEKSIKNVPIPSVNLCLSYLSVQVLVTKENFLKQAHPNYGDLVVFEYIRNVKGKHMFQKVFAYITNMSQIIITSFTEYNKDLGNHVKQPYALLTYTLLTSIITENFVVKRIQRIRTVTYLRSTIRMIQAIQYLPQSPLMNLILNPLIEAFHLPTVNFYENKPFTKDLLNPKQLEAVYKVTNAVLQKEPKICLIQGPPGTGKSKVIVNIITEILYGNNRYQNNKSLRILLCAPSNAAIDEIVLRLLAIRATMKEKRFKMVRIGRPETMHTIVKDISLTELGKRDVKRMTANYSSKNVSIDGFDEEKKLLEARINALKCEITYSHKIDETYRQYLKLKLMDMNAKYELLENHKSIDDMSANELAKFRRVAERRILEGADIITCTLSSCYTNQMESIFGGNREKISVCIVDEATQCCEAENLIPLLLGINTLVLVGDPNQLPATILSQQAKRLGLDQSLFSRIQNAFINTKDNPIIMLNTQYRMAYAISYWPNKFFYGGKLKNEVTNVQKFPFHSYRVFNLNSNQNNDKFSNTNEAEFVSNLIICMILNFNIEKWESNISIGVLTPYNNQKHLITEKFNEKIAAVSDGQKKKFNVEINTVDSFQGQERDIILMSCVRSHGIGFLSDPQRLCVALTRAKHCLILCGNFTTFMRDAMWNALINDSKFRKVYHNMDTNANLYEISRHIDKQTLI